MLSGISNCIVCNAEFVFLSMIIFSGCKINLGLYVTEKRSDGFHNIQSVFYPVAWNDVIEIKKSNSPNKFSLIEYGNKKICKLNEHLCYKAYSLIDKQFHLPPIELHIQKTIPSGAGLGGGSSNGSNTLLLLNNYFKLNITFKELMQFALQLGSDCPFFIENKPAIVTGRGEFIETIPLDLSMYHILIVHPAVHVSTAQAYSNLKPKHNSMHLKDSINKHPGNWYNTIKNDFEPYVFSKFPHVESIKDFMYSTGAVFSLMSGSGSSVYGLFTNYSHALKCQHYFRAFQSMLVESNNIYAEL